VRRRVSAGKRLHVLAFQLRPQRSQEDISYHFKKGVVCQFKNGWPVNLLCEDVSLREDASTSQRSQENIPTVLYVLGHVEAQKMIFSQVRDFSSRTFSPTVHGYVLKQKVLTFGTNFWYLKPHDLSPCHHLSPGLPILKW
jgi:hypothetical protein